MRDSYSPTGKWKTHILSPPAQESTGEDIPIMLLGNKTDKQLERQVLHETGQRLAEVC